MNQRGFTLTELLISIAVIGMIMATIFTLQQQGQLAYLWGAARVEVQQNARLALDIMTRELRSAQSLTSVGANCNTTGANTITFNDSGGTSVTYAVSGTALQRSDTDMIGGLESLKIWCYDSTGYTLTSTLADIRSLKIEIKVQVTETVSSQSLASQHATMESRVKLRNL